MFGFVPLVNHLTDRAWSKFGKQDRIIAASLAKMQFEE